MANLSDQTSSELSNGSGSEIYDALRVSSDRDAAPETLPDGIPTEHVDRRMAANVAMFCSISSETPSRSRRRYTDQHLDRPKKVHLVDRLRLDPTGRVVGWSLPDKYPNVTGMDDNDAASATGETPTSSTPRWPQTIVSPVSPTLPDYPPPVRSPTPPGMPSFGSEKARSYDFRFGAQPQVPARGESLLRRLFQRAQPDPSSGSHRSQRHGIFAEDGTAVLGSFPQRQSGHGAHMLEADDHPFHHRNLSLAQFDGPGTDCNTEHGEEPAREPDSPDPSELPAWVAEIMGEEGMATTPLDSAKPGRPDSYHTCASRPQGTSRQATNAATEGAPCSVEPTQSTAPTIPQDTPTGENSQPEQGWGDVARRARGLIFRCCYGGSEEEPIPQPTGATQDSYVTARNQVSSDSQQPQLEDQTGP